MSGQRFTSKGPLINYGEGGRKTRGGKRASEVLPLLKGGGTKSFSPVFEIKVLHSAFRGCKDFTTVHPVTFLCALCIKMSLFSKENVRKSGAHCQKLCACRRKCAPQAPGAPLISNTVSHTEGGGGETQNILG